MMAANYLYGMSIQTNFINQVYSEIHIDLTNSSSVLSNLHITDRDMINLCGGVPLPNITNIRVVIAATYSSALSVKIFTDQYEVVRNMDFEIKRIDNNFIYVKNKRKGIGINQFLNQLQTARKYGFEKLHAVAMGPEDDLDWDGYFFWAKLGFENTDTDEYKAWAAAMGRKEPTLSELMQTETGRDLWKKTGFTWIGAFYLADDHSCMAYLRKYLKRKGIDFTFDE
jgi:hypothetical protein